jgi:hypothetical protein
LWLIQFSGKNDLMVFRAEKTMNQLEFEKSLQKGDAVRVRWRKGEGHGVIEKVNQSSFSVRLVEEIGKYPKDSLINIKRVKSGRFSTANCVRPREE